MIKHTQSIEAFTALGQLFKDYTLRNKRNDKWIENIESFDIAWKPYDRIATFEKMPLNVTAMQSQLQSMK